MPNFEIKTDTDSFTYRKQTVRVDSHKIETPIKSIDLATVPSEFELNQKVYGISEMYKKFYEKSKIDIRGRMRALSVDDLQRSPNNFEGLNRTLNAVYNKKHDDDFVFCFVEYEGDNYPNKETVELLARVSYKFSDIVPFPILTKIQNRIDKNGIKELTNYLNFLNDFYTEINQRNNKPIMGIIPKLTPRMINRLLDYYIKNELRFFYFDFNGSYPESSSLLIETLLVRLSHEQILDECFIYGLNANIGKLSQKKEAIFTKDIMAFAYGFSCLGKYMGPKVVQIKDLTENRLRIFNKEDYGCYRVTSTDKLEKLYPNDSSIPIELLSNSLEYKIDYRSQKLFNMEQAGIESFNLRKIIEEQKARTYIDTKNYVDKDEIKKIEQLHKKFISSKKQTTLTSF